MTYEDLKSLLEQAEEHNTAGRYEEADRFARNVIDTLRIVEDNQITDSSDVDQRRAELRCGTLLVMADTARLRSEVQLFLTLAEEALSIAEDWDLPALKARALSFIGLAHRNLSEYASALEYYEKALRVDEELGNKTGVARHLGNIGVVHVDLSEYTKALDYHNRALSIAAELGNKAEVARHRGNIGLVHYGLSDYAKALDCFSESLHIAEQLGDKARMATNLGNVGLVHWSLADYQKALECFGKALSIDEVLGNKAGIALWLGNIGIVHAQLSDHGKALEYLGQTLRLAEELGDKAVIANNLNSIGHVFQQLREYDRALEYYSRGMQIQEDIGKKAEAASRGANVGALYANIEWSGHDNAMAERYLLESITADRELGTRRYAAHKTLAELYERQKRWQEANTEWKHYHALRDEVLSEEAKKSAMQMEQKKQIAEREKELSVERAVATATQSVLHQVLPASVADRLVKGEKVADYFQNVSILFADIVGFTPIASRMPAKAVLAFLNHVFNQFDSIVERHGCEKIKTIGDGYMAVAGVPVECNDHAERVALAALEMMNDIHLPEEIRKYLPKESQFSIRIGLHTGSAFAGIVGAKRFVYDVYSDAVNIASRMESHGEPGRIHCSAEFALHLQNRDDRFVFEEREEIDIKGKGTMRTYFLEKR